MFLWKRFCHWRTCYLRGRMLESIVQKRTGGDIKMLDDALKAMAAPGVTRVFIRKSTVGQVWGIFIPLGIIKKK